MTGTAGSARAERVRVVSRARAATAVGTALGLALGLSACGRSMNAGTQAADELRAWIEAHPLPAGELRRIDEENVVPFAGAARAVIGVPVGTDPVPTWRHLCGYEPELDTSFGFLIGGIEVYETPCEEDPAVWTTMVDRLQDVQGLKRAELMRDPVDESQGYLLDAKVTDGPASEPADRGAVRRLVRAVRTLPDIAELDVHDEDGDWISFDYAEQRSDPDLVRRMLDALLVAPVALGDLGSCNPPVRRGMSSDSSASRPARAVCVRPATDKGRTVVHEAVWAVDPAAVDLLVLER